MARIDRGFLAKRALELRDFYAQNPHKFVSAGFYRIESSFQIDSVGRPMDADKIGRLGADARAFRPTRAQTAVMTAFLICKKRDSPVRLNILKARDMGVTTVVGALDFAMGMMNGQRRSASIAHKEDVAQNVIYGQKRTAIRYLPSWMQPPNDFIENDSASKLKFSIPAIGVMATEWCSYTAGTADIENLRGDRRDFLHASECSRFKDAARIYKAISDVTREPVAGARWMSCVVNETTANGKDEFFHDPFKMAWEAQGKNNYWEEGHKFMESGWCSLFLGAHTDWERKRHALPMRNKWSESFALAEFKRVRDEYEREVWERSMMPYYRAIFPNEEAHCERIAAEHLLWRRSRLPHFYSRDDYPYTPAKQGAIIFDLDAYKSENPYTVEEAFTLQDDKPVFPVSAMEAMGRSVREPIAKGSFIGDTFDAYASPLFWIWRMPQEVKACRLSIDIDFCSSTVNVGSILNNTVDAKHDFTSAILWCENEDGTIEQIAEFMGMESPYRCIEQIWQLIIWYIQESVNVSYDRYPFVCPEKGPGASDMVQFLVLGKQYPIHRIYVHQSSDKMGAVVDSGTFGFPRTRPGDVVQSANSAVKHVTMGNLIIRSQRVVNQAANYFWEKGKPQARRKSKGGDTSKDDFVVCVCMEAYRMDWGQRTAPLAEAPVSDIVYRPRVIDMHDHQLVRRLIVAAEKQGLDGPHALPVDPSEADDVFARQEMFL